jgi:hypothetical protein
MPPIKIEPDALEGVWKAGPVCRETGITFRQLLDFPYTLLECGIVRPAATIQYGDVV